VVQSVTFQQGSLLRELSSGYSRVDPYLITICVREQF